MKLLIFFVVISPGFSCVLREISPGKSVCVCNASYCDEFPQVKSLLKGKVFIVSTQITRLGTKEITKNISRVLSEEFDTKIQVNRKKTYQKIIGFGGAFTDSFGISLLKLPESAQDNLLKSYFSPEGSQYRMGRVPMGSTDFSTRLYTYLDQPSNNLNNFQLQEEDFLYKIPVIKKASKFLGQNLKLLAASWTAPPWMKSNNDFKGGFLKTQFFQTWAEYYLKFFEEYFKNGVNFWGLTSQNEPLGGFFEHYPSTGWFFNDMNRFIGQHLGPLIRNSNFSHLKLMVHDESRLLLPLIGLLLENDLTLKFVDGVAVHWYEDFFTPPSFLNFATSNKKDLFILKTEACSGTFLVDHEEPVIDLGSWTRGEHYITNIIEDLQYNVSGWIDWNLALDLKGGPSYTPSGNDAPILINENLGEFYKQPMYYALAHFSKFLEPNSIRLDFLLEGTQIETTIFQRPDNTTALIVYNRLNHSLILRLEDDQITQFKLEPKTIYSIIY